MVSGFITTLHYQFLKESRSFQLKSRSIASMLYNVDKSSSYFIVSWQRSSYPKILTFDQPKELTDFKTSLQVMINNRLIAVLSTCGNLTSKQTLINRSQLIAQLTYPFQWWARLKPPLHPQDGATFSRYCLYRNYKSSQLCEPPTEVESKVRRNRQTDTKTQKEIG